MGPSDFSCLGYGFSESILSLFYIIEKNIIERFGLSL